VLCVDPKTCLGALLVFTREVDAWRVREIAFLMPLPSGRLFVGAAGLRSYWTAFSANVCRFDAGSGTAEVRGMFAVSHDGTAILQPEGLCLLEAAVGRALREFMFASCNSPRGRPCDIPSLGSWVGGFKPEGFEKPYIALS
jgi:hypothetical protein